MVSEASAMSSAALGLYASERRPQRGQVSGKAMGCSSLRVAGQRRARFSSCQGTLPMLKHLVFVLSVLSGTQ